MINAKPIKTPRALTISVFAAAFLGILTEAALNNAAVAEEPLLHKSALKSGVKENSRQWTVAETSGLSLLRTLDGRWVQITKGSVIVPGHKVETRASGRVVLKRPGDSVLISPNSVMTVPRRTGTHVLQSLGTLLFKITTRPDRPFNVKTPYLAAVIKGTVFTVAVNDNGSALHVTKGAVQVTSILTKRGVLVRPGQTATVDIRRGGRLKLANSGPRKAKTQVTKVTFGGGKTVIAKARGAARINLHKATRGLVNKTDMGLKSAAMDGNSPGKTGVTGPGKTTGKTAGNTTPNVPGKKRNRGKSRNRGRN